MSLHPMKTTSISLSAPHMHAYGTYLHRVHGNVDASIQQCLINLLCEQALAANVCQGLTQDLVTCGLDDDDLKSTLLSKLWEVGLRQ